LVSAAYKDIAVTRNEPTIRMRSSLIGNTPSALPEDDDSEAFEYLDDFELESVKSMFTKRLEQLRPKEIDRGLTLCGPQRDDLVLLLNQMPAKNYASHGEGWSYALSLRLASRQLLRQDGNFGDPVLILDDVFAELDAKRRQKLAELVSDNEQVLITAAVAEDVPEQLKARMFHVEQGRVSLIG